MIHVMTVKAGGEADAGKRWRFMRQLLEKR